MKKVVWRALFIFMAWFWLPSTTMAKAPQQPLTADAYGITAERVARSTAVARSLGLPQSVVLADLAAAQREYSKQSLLLAKSAVKDGARLVAKDTDQSLIARLKRWWQKKEAAPLELENESISEEKLEDTRKSVEALLN